MAEFDEVEQEIIEALERCIELGLVEIVGINDKGEWLYGATPKGVQVAEAGMIDGIIDGMIDEGDIQ